MATKALLVFCVQTLLIKTISGSCFGHAAWEGARVGNRLAYENDYGAAPEIRAKDGAIAAGPARDFEAIAPFACNDFGGAFIITPAALSASYGGGLSTASSSPIAPTGVSLVSENAIEGVLAAFGRLPFLGTVSLEGGVPTSGSAAVSYGCGNGEVGIISEDFAGLGGYGAGAIGYGAAKGPALGAAAAPIAANAAAANALAYGSRVPAFAVPAGGCGCGRGLLY